MINSLPQSRINYELLDILFREKTLHKLHPECMEIVNFLKNDENSLVSKLRLNSVVTRIVIESSGASNKSNAGLAGEEFVKVIFDLVGLKENLHYKFHVFVHHITLHLFLLLSLLFQCYYHLAM